jgi:hypothetical protein
MGCDGVALWLGKSFLGAQSRYAPHNGQRRGMHSKREGSAAADDTASNIARIELSAMSHLRFASIAEEGE